MRSNLVNPGASHRSVFLSSGVHGGVEKSRDITHQQASCGTLDHVSLA
jgi:hypothetical protein